MQTSLLSRAKSWIDGIPIVTRILFVLCTSIYLIFNLLLGWTNFGTVCLGLQPIISNYQLYRLLTAPLIHGNLLHIAFNMLALISIGSIVEQNIGSTSKYVTLIILLFLFGDTLYLLLALLTSLIPFAAQIASQCAVGFSGVIFGLIPVEIRLSRATHRSLFGLVSLPAFIYPWALLVFWQFLVPQSSFLGHLSGLALGELYCFSTGLNSSTGSVFGRFGTGSSDSNYNRDEATPLILPLHYNNSNNASDGGSSGLVDRMKAWWSNVVRSQPHQSGAVRSDEAHSSTGAGNGSNDVDDGMSREDKAGAAAAAAEARMLQNT